MVNMGHQGLTRSNKGQQRSTRGNKGQKGAKWATCWLKRATKGNKVHLGSTRVNKG